MRLESGHAGRCARRDSYGNGAKAETSAGGPAGGQYAGCFIEARRLEEGGDLPGGGDAGLVAGNGGCGVGFKCARESCGATAAALEHGGVDCRDSRSLAPGLRKASDRSGCPAVGRRPLSVWTPRRRRSIASIPAEAANSEGGITTGAGAVWFVVKPSKLLRIDPRTNAIVATVELPSDSDNLVFSDGFVWVSSYGHDALLKVDPKTNTVMATIAIGPKPRFLTAGAGSIWTLNQGDGSITRVDMATDKVVASIACGIQGGGGEISYDAGFVWATMFDFPLTQIDAKTNKVVHQWAGQGGDGLRAGLGSVWLSNLRQGTVWRISPAQ